MRIYPTIHDRKIRFALIGCGRIAKNHFASIKKHAENFELVSIFSSTSSVGMLRSISQMRWARPYAQIFVKQTADGGAGIPLSMQTPFIARIYQAVDHQRLQYV
jgi:hypothetical protein